MTFSARELRSRDSLKVDWRSPQEIVVGEFPAMQSVFHTDTWLVLREPDGSLLWVFEKGIREMGGGPVEVFFRFCFDPSHATYGFEAMFPWEQR